MDAEWLGFRVSLEQSDAEAEFVFTVPQIVGEMRPDIDKIAGNLLNDIKHARSHLDDILNKIVV
jgi:hypothetical protein